jgi:DNA-binding Xre family transcriptional regulator
MKGMKAMRIDRWKVKQQMKIVGIRTFGELAERVGVSQAAMSAWFRGAAFSSGSLESLLRELQCTPNDILTLDPNLLAPVAELATTAG